MPKRIGFVTIDAERCKGCGLCVVVCPVHGLALSDRLNHRGYHPARFVPGAPCTGCGVCFYACPEPAALSVHVRGDDDGARSTGGTTCRRN